MAVASRQSTQDCDVFIERACIGMSLNPKLAEPAFQIPIPTFTTAGSGSEFFLGLGFGAVAGNEK